MEVPLVSLLVESGTKDFGEQEIKGGGRFGESVPSELSVDDAGF